MRGCQNDSYGLVTMGFLEREPCLKRTLSNGFWSLINLDLVPYVVGCLSLHSEDRHTIHTVSYLGMTLLKTSGPVIGRLA